MRIITWNCNAIRPRMTRLLGILERHRPDIVCLQETRVTDGEFPALELRTVGYHAAAHGQKGRNGVAILTREPAADVLAGLSDSEDDPQARIIAATVRGVRVLCAYPPNGAMVGSPEWMYKLRWFTRLRDHLGERYHPGEPLALVGDLNVSPEERDVYDARIGERHNYFHPRIREAFAELCAWGLVDVFRKHQNGPSDYTWWDYRARGFEKNIGLRLDHVLATRPLADRSTAAFVDREERGGANPSDHAPVIADFDWP